MLNNKSDKFNPIYSTQLFGLENYFNDLAKLKEKNKFPKVLLLSGEKGSGKFTLSFHLINFFFSNNDNDKYDLKNLKINTSSSFYKKILLNVNENFSYIGKNNNKNVSIEEVREIKKKFSTSSLNNLPKFTIIDDVELLNLNAANALLKLVEEPSDLNYLILINNKRCKMIDTLKSRSIEFKIFINRHKKEKTLKSLIDKFDIQIPDYSNFILKNSPGQILRISECLSDVNADEKKDLPFIVDIFLDKFKKSKDQIYIDTIKFLLDFKIHEHINIYKSNYLKIDFIKNNINKKLFQFERFSLSKGSVLESFKELF